MACTLRSCHRHPPQGAHLFVATGSGPAIRTTHPIARRPSLGRTSLLPASRTEGIPASRAFECRCLTRLRLHTRVPAPAARDGCTAAGVLHGRVPPALRANGRNARTDARSSRVAVGDACKQGESSSITCGQVDKIVANRVAQAHKVRIALGKQRFLGRSWRRVR